MKIGTVTVHHAHNYGAMLQAYALQHALKKINCETVLIDYDEIKSKIFVKVNTNSLKQILSGIYYNVIIFMKYKEMKRGFDRFEKFYNDELDKTDKYVRLSDIKVDDIDMLLVGSDQIWNMKNKDNRPFFELNFGGKIRKASYAASMGSYFTLTEEVKKHFINSLGEFDYISVREKETGEYIKKITGKDYRIDIDPVFLLEMKDWDSLCEKAKCYELPNEYILCYELINSDKTKICLEEMKRKTGLPVVVITPNIYCNLKEKYIIRDAGPIEMVDLIRKAKYVVTTSFHGIVFSILYNRSFQAILTNHGVGRIKELLTNMRLEKQIFSDVKSINLNCDFNYSNEFICGDKMDSYNYLLKLKETCKCVE